MRCVRSCSIGWIGAFFLKAFFMCGHCCFYPTHFNRFLLRRKNELCIVSLMQIILVNVLLFFGTVRCGCLKVCEKNGAQDGKSNK